jgi:hypothetical protein
MLLKRRVLLMKKVSIFCLVMCMLFTSIVPSFASIENDEEKLLKSFEQEIQKNTTYMQYKNQLTNKEPTIKRVNYTENGEVLFVLYEMENDNGMDNKDNLIFLKEINPEQIHVILVEYTGSDLVVHNLTTNEAMAIRYQNFECATWFCTDLETGGGYEDYKCATIMGGLCILLDKAPIWAKVVCYLGTVVGCYVPKYKICFDGEWRPMCPI